MSSWLAASHAIKEEEKPHCSYSFNFKKLPTLFHQIFIGSNEKRINDLYKLHNCNEEAKLQNFDIKCRTLLTKRLTVENGHKESNFPWHQKIDTDTSYFTVFGHILVFSWCHKHFEKSLTVNIFWQWKCTLLQSCQRVINEQNRQLDLKLCWSIFLIWSILSITVWYQSFEFSFLRYNCATYTDHKFVFHSSQ